GVFLCIDCSATHRNLGVHLTFVRSTNLDVNWTWLQLRAMQVGGNANAMQFFKHHGCNSNDAQIKYKSRAAQLYREKLAQLCREVQNKYGNTVHIDTAAVVEEHKEEDFFAQDFVHTSQSATSLSSEAYIAKENDRIGSDGDLCDNHGPKVDHIDSEPVATSAPVSIILKKPIKKAGGAKKSALGAQKVRIDFDELEQRAAEHEKNHAEVGVTASQLEKLETHVDPVAKLSARLAMQDIQKKASEDPQKAAAVDRLGMGGFGRPRAAHSVAQGVKPIRQVDLSKRVEPTISLSQKSEDDWEVVEEKSLNKNDDDLFTTDFSSKSRTDFFDSWDDQQQEMDNKRSTSSNSAARKPVLAAPQSDVDIQKKFAGAKAISSDMYFGSNEMECEFSAPFSDILMIKECNFGDLKRAGAPRTLYILFFLTMRYGFLFQYETKAALSRFEGQTSLGSADLWGQGSQPQYSQVPEMSDIKDSLRAGASKVAEKFSSISTSFSSYMSDP
ncbi:putative GTP-ase activating protein, partial [Ostertagia ostertagi]